MSGTVRGRIHSFESFGAVDGPGIRCVVFMQGCPLRCRYCHNPDTWTVQGGQETDSAEVFRRISAWKSFIRRGGVTLSGGEPLLQPEFAADILRRCQAAGFHTALDTAGSLPLDNALKVLPYTDLVLLDIKALEAELCRELTGQDNRNALALLECCEERGQEVWIRHVLVPGITLDEARMRNLAEYLSGFKCISRIELLPFHQLGSYKWAELGFAYTLAETPEPSAAEVAAARAVFGPKA